MKFSSLFLGSFYSAKTYRDVRASGGFFMGYALVVVLACTLSATIYFTHFIHREIFAEREGKIALFDDVVTQIAEQLPVMTLKDNTLTSSEAAAKTISISGSAFGQSFSDLAIITVDTSGTTTHENMKTPMLITATEVIFKGDKETKIKPLSEITKDGPSTLLINHAMAEDMAAKLIELVHEKLLTFYVIVGAIVWFFFAAYMYVMRIFMLLALGLAGLAIAQIQKTPLKYAQAVGLASVSYTPVAILDTILFAGIFYPAGALSLFAAGAVALYAAIHCSNEAPPRQLIG